MQLNPADAQLYLKLQAALYDFVAAQSRGPEEKGAPKPFRELPFDEQVKIRQALLDAPELRDQFVLQNPSQLPADELAIVASWKFWVKGRFLIMRHLQHYTIFLSTSTPALAYGVVGLLKPIEALVGPQLPVLIDAVLLPFRNQIIFDGVLNRLSLSFGPGLRKSLNDDYRTAKEQFGIVSALPFEASRPAPAKSKPKAVKKPEKSPPIAQDKAQLALTDISALVGQFCRTHLDAECAELCQKLAEKLARKRPSPLMSGKPAAWAAGIVRAIAYVNFLDDPRKTPHIKPAAIDAGFGVSESTGQSKSLLIRKTLHIRQLEPAWTLTSRLDDNPFVWMLEVNGFIIDIRTMPRDAQQAAFEQGLIPYIPADRAGVANVDSDVSPAHMLF